MSGPLDVAARYMAPVEPPDICSHCGLPVGLGTVHVTCGLFPLGTTEQTLRGPSPLSRFSNFESTLLWVMRDYQALLDGKAKPQGIFDAVVEADEFKKCWDRLSPPEQDFLRSLDALLREIAPVG